MNEPILPALFPEQGPFPRLSRRLRLGVVGGGRVASMQCMAARMTDCWDVVAGSLSSDASAARARASVFRIPEDRAYTSFEEMAKAESGRDDGVDAVMITTPNHLHASACKVFLDYGIAVLCDKPMTNTMTDAEALVACANQSQQVFGVSYVMSCFPMVRQARQLVQDGRIGEVNQVYVEFFQDWMTPPDVVEADHVKWRLDPAQSGATSCTGDIGTHAAHLASFVSNLELTDIRAEMHVCGVPKPLEDTVIMMTRYNQSVPGTLVATRQAPGNRGGLRVRVYGSKGGLEWDLEQPERLRFNEYGAPDAVYSRGQGHGVDPSIDRLTRTARGFSEGIIEAWANLYAEFAIAVSARSEGVELQENYIQLPSVVDGVRGVKFIEAAVQSNENGGIWTDCRYAPS